MRNLALIAAIGAAAAASPALAQPYDPGPQFSVPGSSVAGMRIGGAPPKLQSRSVPNAPVFGDTVEERYYGRPYDDSYLHPRIPRGSSEAGSIQRRARQGDPGLDPARAGEFARSGPSAIGSSEVTRDRTRGSGNRAVIRK